ncbi:hypothetical protein U2G67_002667 [Vibrio parahaemolyticus]|nr:hypothetical protein [Vibrio parahaemolyticus]
MCIDSKTHDWRRVPPMPTKWPKIGIIVINLG